MKEKLIKLIEALSALESTYYNDLCKYYNKTKVIQNAIKLHIINELIAYAENDLSNINNNLSEDSAHYLFREEDLNDIDKIKDNISGFDFTMQGYYAIAKDISDNIVRLNLKDLDNGN